MPTDTDDKYVTFKRSDLREVLRAADMTKDAVEQVEHFALEDAVVIRRQDFFASPALAGYAAAIAIALKLIDDNGRRTDLLAVADYFQRQSELAADEGSKFPTP